LKSAYGVIHPEWLVFVDEVGSNTLQAKDRAIGGQTYLCAKHGHLQQRAATTESHFTVLGFTATNGKPIMCAIIFATKTKKHEWVPGFDPFVEWTRDENDVNQNIGYGNAMPKGPEVMFGSRCVLFLLQLKVWEHYWTALEGNACSN
jgi:hypothetical protein